MSERRILRLMATTLLVLGLLGTGWALAAPFDHSAIFLLSVAAGIVALVIFRPTPERPNR